MAPTPPPAAAPEPSGPPPQTAFQKLSKDTLNDANGRPRAIVALADEGESRSVAGMLQQQGYVVDEPEPWEERVIELQQGVYNLVVTRRNGSPSSRQNGLFHLVNTVTSEVRSRLFLVLVGDEYRTGNPTEAFASLADFVCQARDLSAADSLLRSTIAEKGRLYKVYLDIQRRKDRGEL